MAVLMVAEDEFWQPGLDFCAALRHRGHTVIRLTAEDPHGEVSRGARRWRAVPTANVAGAIDRHGIPTKRGLEVIDAVRPVDWQATEPILNWLSTNGYEKRLSFDRTTGLPVERVQDKRDLTAFLERQGLAVPATWHDIAHIPATQSGPFMFKLRDQGGGDGIVRCDDLDELAACAALYAPAPYIVQRFYHATPVIAAGVAKAGQVVQMMTYVSIVNPDTPFRMAYGLRVVDDPHVRAYAQRVLAVLGLTGPFALDTVADDSLGPLALDMNVRVWGSWTACRAVGMDVVGAYEYAMGIGVHPGSMDLVAESASILRRPPMGVSTMPERARWLAAEGAEIRRRSQWLGGRWARCSLRDAVGWAGRGPAL